MCVGLQHRIAVFAQAADEAPTQAAAALDDRLCGHQLGRVATFRARKPPDCMPDVAGDRAMLLGIRASGPALDVAAETAHFHTAPRVVARAMRALGVSPDAAVSADSTFANSAAPGIESRDVGG